MASILVTGGAGFIGSHAVDQYIAAGHNVTVVDDLSSGSRGNLNSAARFVELDIRSADLFDVFADSKPEFVMHFAAQMDVRKSLEVPLFDADVNVRGTINLLECCVKHGARRILFASTGGAIYGQPDTLPASEECPPRPICHYGCSKLCAEQYITLYQRVYGLEYMILRFPNVYGPRQNPHGEAGVCAILASLMLQGKTPILYGNGDPLRDYVYVGDIARGCLLALDHGRNDIVNLGSGKGTSVRDLFEIMKPHTGFDGEPNLQPLRPGEVERIFTTGDHAAEVLGWRAVVGLEEGLGNTVAFVRSNGG
ncbi:MAG: NAD-dependent epimerase/dehydratase family protein [Candidatus Hydrogenedentes bacterium]|nr:NAD-dependent epimerase/dehydratase family protein [Candidatus Hydrogenedentota bacterium]